MRFSLALAGLLGLSACSLPTTTALDALIRSGVIQALIATDGCLPADGTILVSVGGPQVLVAHADLIARGLVRACP